MGVKNEIVKCFFICKGRLISVEVRDKLFYKRDVLSLNLTLHIKEQQHQTLKCLHHHRSFQKDAGKEEGWRED